MKNLKKAIRQVKRFIKIAFKGCWLAAKVDFYYSNPFLLPLGFLARSIYRRLVDKYTRSAKHKEILKQIRAEKRQKKKNKLTAKMMREYYEYKDNQLKGDR